MGPRCKELEVVGVGGGWWLGEGALKPKAEEDGREGGTDDWGGTLMRIG